MLLSHALATPEERAAFRGLNTIPHAQCWSCKLVSSTCNPCFPELWVMEPRGCFQIHVNENALNAGEFLQVNTMQSSQGWENRSQKTHLAAVRRYIQKRGIWIMAFCTWWSFLWSQETARTWISSLCFPCMVYQSVPWQCWSHGHPSGSGWGTGTGPFSGVRIANL